MFEVSYQRITDDSPHFANLTSLFKSEWPEYEPEGDSTLPKPIVAIVEGQVVGGIAYTKFAEPKSDREVIWVNAVYVSEAWRHRGIAHKLIFPGRQQVKSQSKLYAYTHVPGLYESLGWLREDKNDQASDVVMSCSLE
ncbi:hypothetical protein JCM19232_4248 [Vibrio ishigakensis]|uniref:N-acetyltransferase domain-containing protein n=1 Tax=Vibrio ishigakensis TaxID=1481914 RepID=A0A0B8PQ66_9VIBR|nr:hypothetical protein JCM19232_4248 [Vibrio ishigakensis]